MFSPEESLTAILKQESAKHQTVFYDDRVRKQLLSIAADKILKLESDIAQGLAASCTLQERAHLRAENAKLKSKHEYLSASESAGWSSSEEKRRSLDFFKQYIVALEAECDSDQTGRARKAHHATYSQTIDFTI